MTWTLDTVNLPFGGPTSIEWGIVRKQTANKIVENFPFPVDVGPNAMELKITGKITGATEIDKLREVVKRAEKQTIQLIVTDPEFTMYGSGSSTDGLYAVGRAKIGQKGPQFDASTGLIVQDYDITLVQFAEGGSVGEGDTADLIEDEEGVSFGDLNTIFEDALFDQFPNLYDLING